MSQNRTRFEMLVHRASREPLPPFDVADRVARSIEARAHPRIADWPSWGVAGLSLAAALVVLIVAAYHGILFEDPFAHWLRSLVLVMQ